MVSNRHFLNRALLQQAMLMAMSSMVGNLVCIPCAAAQVPPPHAAAPKPTKAPAKPKLVVLLVVDQMRADYFEKFQGQWTGGLKRLVEEGAWFREAAYPYAATETCVGHSTISTGAFPATHGMIANEWFDRELQKTVTCTSDPLVKNVGYGGVSAKGGDSPAKMVVPAFADELKFQTGSGSRIVTFSLKARASITMGGRLGDAVTWFDASTGAWSTSSAYPIASFVEEYAKAHPASSDFGKTWAPMLPSSAYLYDATPTGAIPPTGLGAAFPHPLRGKSDSTGPDPVFYYQWEASPYADTHLTRLAELAVDKLELGARAGTDFLGVSYSSVDYVGHAFGPRSWEIQDVLARLDQDLAELFAHLDKKVGKGNYVVAFSADHGVVPIPEDLQKSGMDAGWLNVESVKELVEKSLEPFNFAKPSVAEVGAGDVYFTPGAYDKLKNDPAALRAVLDAIQSVPGVAHVYRAEELDDRPASQSPMLKAESASFLKARSGDLLIVPKPYWPWDFSTSARPRQYRTTHGTPYYYDQRVPVLLMGWGIQPGEFHGTITPADIAPTLASLCGITLAPRDGRVLAEALKKPAEFRATTLPVQRKSAPASAPARNP
jgi:predicted AlkP superfamily pyrophosphatase or phosphodiesterase